MFVVPLPDFGADGFAHAAQDAQAAQVVAFGPGFVHAHEGADDRGCGVEDIDAEVFHNAPVTVGVGPGGDALKHEGGGPQGERAVDPVGMAGDPARVGCAPVDVVVAHVKAPLGGVGGVGQVAARGVHDARGFARAAAGVEQKEGIFGVHGFAGEVGVEGEVVNEVVPPDVAVALHGHAVQPGVAHHHHMGYGGAFFQDEVEVGLEGFAFAPAHGGVGGNDHAGLAAFYAAAHAAFGVAGEDGRVDGPDAGAGQHGDEELWNHGHVQGHMVALANAQGA